MKYVVMNMNGDVYNDEFDNEKEAINRAEYRWNHLTSREKKRDDLIVLVSNDPDEDSVYHFDGNPIWKNGERIGVKKCGKCKYRAYSSWCGIDYCIDYEMATTEDEEIEAAKDCVKYEEGTPSCFEDDDYCPSATAGDYSPSSPWNAPGMSIRDFI